MPSQELEHWHREKYGGKYALMPSYRSSAAIKQWLDERRASGAIRSSCRPSEGAHMHGVW